MQNADFHSPITRLPDYEITKSSLARWLDTATLSPDGKTTTATRLITPAHPFVENNHFLPSALIELMAQAAAAGSILNAQKVGGGQNKKIRRGLLASLRDFQILAPLPVTALITLTATHEKSFGPLTSTHLQAHIHNQLIAQARMTFHLEFD
jgi:predicted hotdog family 3-hydroxylacyl-ACP dehydratase